MGKYDLVQRKCIRCNVSASKYNRKTKQYKYLNYGYEEFEQDFEIDKKKFTILVVGLVGILIMILIIYTATGVI